VLSLLNTSFWIVRWSASCVFTCVKCFRVAFFCILTTVCNLLCLRDYVVCVKIGSATFLSRNFFPSIYGFLINLCFFLFFYRLLVTIVKVLLCCIVGFVFKFVFFFIFVKKVFWRHLLDGMWTNYKMFFPHCGSAPINAAEPSAPPNGGHEGITITKLSALMNEISCCCCWTPNQVSTAQLTGLDAQEKTRSKDNQLFFSINSYFLKRRAKKREQLFFDVTYPSAHAVALLLQCACQRQLCFNFLLLLLLLRFMLVFSSAEERTVLMINDGDRGDWRRSRNSASGGGPLGGGGGDDMETSYVPSSAYLSGHHRGRYVSFLLQKKNKQN